MRKLCMGITKLIGGILTIGAFGALITLIVNVISKKWADIPTYLGLFAFFTALSLPFYELLDKLENEENISIWRVIGIFIISFVRNLMAVCFVLVIALIVDSIKKARTEAIIAGGIMGGGLLLVCCALAWLKKKLNNNT